MTVIGLDIGGSKTQAVKVSDAGAVLGEALSGSANISSVGPAEAGRQLDLVLDLVGVDGVRAVCAGAAGVETPSGAAVLTKLIADRVPGARIRVVHDTELILAAAAVRDGVAVISGTGAVAWGRSGDRHVRAGGWGYLLGDEGSGYWVAREAVKRTLGRIDREEPADRLGQQLAADCGLQDTSELLDHFYAQTERRYWAGRARVVFELAGSGDPASRAIVDEAAASLAAIAVSVGERLGSKGPVVLAGGLAVHQPALQEGIREQLAPHGFDDVRVLTDDPVRGAVLLAHESISRD
ncbi:BadF/BadG/BcrA/BcrD ATPase family protein [Tsukamurella sp. 8F]|uniref:N-acetylglucosamine kinase n=1 Tax=unclassified Tsukamurella TaxID=2633480 RepID=UPI0023B89CF4|nr:MULTISPECIES: BadF/BadG/BcrA/BcrD ATPase family protein [unclassified Tsukamurella]MDF0529231.1 BadF/BadG/BcrA/BcrD ATPase family protein [Tsukamurella sp. 8J]MDF0585416.1 BadF/BadG/BcrA/BcrD ATPase family protein [Tsukamurella sp. 8F]